MGNKRRFAKFRRMTAALSEQNLRFLERRAEYHGISLSEMLRRILCDLEEEYRQYFAAEREREREKL
ncbi:MAG TPA: hypothetical protein VNN62_15000 [Methylomirabilota bacterium]|jgi:hypothetical protein|nr:hypothetical protein [Methylomirabilota bacterium]